MKNYLKSKLVSIEKETKSKLKFIDYEIQKEIVNLRYLDCNSNLSSQLPKEKLSDKENQFKGKLSEKKNQLKVIRNDNIKELKLNLDDCIFDILEILHTDTPGTPQGSQDTMQSTREFQRDTGSQNITDGMQSTRNFQIVSLISGPGNDFNLAEIRLFYLSNFLANCNSLENNCKKIEMDFMFTNENFKLFNLIYHVMNKNIKFPLRVTPPPNPQKTKEKQVNSIVVLDNLLNSISHENERANAEVSSKISALFLQNDHETIATWTNLYLYWLEGVETIFSKHGVNLSLNRSIPKILPLNATRIPVLCSHNPQDDSSSTRVLFAIQHRYPVTKRYLSHLDLKVIEIAACTLKPNSYANPKPQSNPLLDHIHDLTLNALQDRVSTTDPSITTLLARSKLAFQILAPRSTTPVILDPIGPPETGIHVQYSYARLCGIHRSLQVTNPNGLNTYSALIRTPLVFTMLDLLYLTKNVMAQSRRELSASYMTGHMSFLAKTVSTLYYSMRVKGEEGEVFGARWECWRAAMKGLERWGALYGVEMVQEI